MLCVYCGVRAPGPPPMAMPLPQMPLLRVPQDLCLHLFVPWCPPCGKYGPGVWASYEKCVVKTRELREAGSPCWAPHDLSRTACFYCCLAGRVSGEADLERASANACLAIVAENSRNQ